MSDRLNRARQDPPLEVQASLADVLPGLEARDRWWRPGWKDAMQHLTWEWVLLLPAVAAIGFVFAAFLRPQYFVWVWWLGIKWMGMAVLLPVVLLGDLMRRAAAARKEPFCIHCGYELTGLPDRGRCPECGSSYTRELIEEYRRDPQWFIQRYKQHQKLPSRDVPFEAGPSGARKRSRDGT